MTSFYRLALASTLVLALAACSGSGGGGLGNILGPINSGSLECNTGTQVELANPPPGATVSGNIGQVVIVANGSNNNLYDTYNQWNLTLTDQYGDVVQGGALSLVSDPGGPHPYPSDYYYVSHVGQLPAGETCNVSLSQKNGAYCSAVPLQSFKT